MLKDRPQEADGIDSVIVVDNVPQVGPDRLEKLKNVIHKIFSKFGKITNDFYPEEEGKTKGCVGLRVPKCPPSSCVRLPRPPPSPPLPPAATLRPSSLAPPHPLGLTCCSAWSWEVCGLCSRQASGC